MNVITGCRLKLSSKGRPPAGLYDGSTPTRFNVLLITITIPIVDKAITVIQMKRGVLLMLSIYRLLLPKNRQPVPAPGSTVDKMDK
jgi:hypothetical protein